MPKLVEISGEDIDALNNNEGGTIQSTRARKTALYDQFNSFVIRGESAKGESNDIGKLLEDKSYSEVNEYFKRDS